MFFGLRTSSEARVQCQIWSFISKTRTALSSFTLLSNVSQAQKLPSDPSLRSNATHQQKDKPTWCREMTNDSAVWDEQCFICMLNEHLRTNISVTEAISWLTGVIHLGTGKVILPCHNHCQYSVESGKIWMQSKVNILNIFLSEML